MYSGIILSFPQFQKHFIKHDTCIIILASHLILLSIYIIPILINKPAFILGITRYEYLNLPYVKLFNIKLLICLHALFLGLLESNRSYILKFRNVLLISTIFVMFCYGEKLSGFLILSSYFFSGFILTSKKFNLKIIFTNTLFISFSLILIYLIVILLQGKTLIYSLGAFIYRMSLQGQAYWVTDLYSFVYNHEFKIGLLDNLNYYSDHTQLGNEFIKNYFISSKESHMEGSWAAVYPSILCLNQSYLGFILISIVFNFFNFLIYNIILSNGTFRLFSIFSIIICYYYSVVLKVFQSGNMYLLTHPKFILLTGLLLLIAFYNNFTKSKIKNY